MKCLACGNESGFKKLSPELCTADNWLCSQCGLVFIPRENRGKSEYYKDGGYYTKSPNLGSRRFLTSKHLLLHQARQRVARMQQLLGTPVDGQKVLDVGCGYGEIVGFLKAQHNCQVTGMEPSADTARDGEKLFSIRIIPALFEEHDFGDEQFDLIISNHTLEHVEDPERFLRLVKPRIKPGGRLYLELPNILWPSGGFTLKTFLYDEHLQTPSAWNLAMLLKRCGYTIHAYSDRDWLRFACGVGDGVGVEVPAIPSADVEAFLRAYKKNYSLLQHARVYAGKAAYLIHVCYSKVIDRFSTT
jgi:2-polyprenyl-3-methyl-5-hydroxy-6-metoxy-1,4-benzoquinol methylase